MTDDVERPSATACERVIAGAYWRPDKHTGVAVVSYVSSIVFRQQLSTMAAQAGSSTTSGANVARSAKKDAPPGASIIWKP